MNDALFAEHKTNIQAMPTDQNNLTTVKDVLDYLIEDQGRKIAKSKLYKDIKNGFPPKRDGMFPIDDLEKYAETLPYAEVSEQDSEESANLSRQKAEKEIEKLEEDILKKRQQRLKEAGKLIDREDVEVELAARAVTLETGLKTAFETNTLEIIHLVDGSPLKAAELNLKIEQLINAALNEYAAPIQYEVTLYAESDGTESEDTDE